MNQTEWDNLSEGDLIRHKMASEAYTVMGNYKRGGVVLSRSTLASNPREWDLVASARYTMNEDLPVPALITRTDLIEELRESFSTRLKNAQHHAENSQSFQEFWKGTVSALETSMDKLEALEEAISGPREHTGV
jgi:hypothetical protein